MTRADFSDEILMRFADGELDAGTAAEVERAMETDDALVARVALFIETRHAAKAAMEPLLDERYLPNSSVRSKNGDGKVVATSVSDAGILPFPRRAANESHRSRWLAPVAASLAAVVAGFGGYWLRGSVEAPIEGGLRVAAIGSPALDEALATVAAGEERRLPGSNQRFRAIATFRDNGQALCREFELDSDDRSTVVSVACRAGSEWRVTFAVIAPGANGGYAPASSTETLDAYLTAIDAGTPLEAAEEAKVLGELRGSQR